MITMPDTTMTIYDYLLSVRVHEEYIDKYYLNDTADGSICPPDAIVTRVSPKPYAGVQFITCEKDNKQYEIRWEC